MQSVSFTAYGHENVVANHRTTVEITSEDFLTPQGTCIVGIRSTITLNALSAEIKRMATLGNTKIILRLGAKGITEEIEGRGSPGLSYSDSISMVVRTSDFECGRTLMVRANKAAMDLSRDLIDLLQTPNIPIECELVYIRE